MRSPLPHNGRRRSTFLTWQVEQLCAEHDTVADFLRGLKGLTPCEY